MKKHALFALALGLCLSWPAFPQQKVREKDLGAKFQQWLNLTAYIILPQEREVFLKLESDQDREAFITSFWRQRDPTPGTPQNEYQDEIIRRFNHANKEFIRDTSRPGWMTDMGQYYIILGPPNSIERFDAQRDIHPCQIWNYYGDMAKGLPAHFGLVFFRKDGVGEYKLYNPLADGPASLLMNTFGLSVDNSLQVFEKLREVAPSLAPLSLSPVPGDIRFDYQPSMQAEMIFADILNSPKKAINPSYATHFLNFTGKVSTEYLTNYVESEASVAVLPDPPLGIDFLHFSVTPKNVSVDYFEPKDQYYCNYSVDVSLRRGEKIFYQYSKDFPFYFDPDNASLIAVNGISIQDSFPVIAGTYELTILLKNSVGKEFSVVEKKIVNDENTVTPRLSEAVLGYKLEESADHVHTAFCVLNKRLSVDSKNTYAPGESLAFLLSAVNIPEGIWRNGEVRVAVMGLKAENPSQKSFSLKLSAQPYHATMSLADSVPTAGLPPDYYVIEFSLADDQGKSLDVKKANFIIAPGPAVSRPVIISKSFPLANAYLYFYTLAGQHDKSGERERAELLYRKSNDMAPDFKEGIVYHANFLIRSGDYDKAMRLAENIAGVERLGFDYHLIRGRALTRLGRYEQAKGELLEANKIYNSDTRLLNALGLCFFKTGDKAKALEALKASLSLNPGQPDIQSLIEEIRK